MSGPFLEEILPPDVLRAVRRAFGDISVDALAQKTDEELYRTPDLGARSVRIIRQALYDSLF